MKINKNIHLILIIIITLALGCQKKNSPPVSPYNPYPETNSENLSDYLTLSWSCTDPDGDILSYDIYFGTDTIPPLVEENNTVGFYSTPKLELGTKYYWFIIAEDGNTNQSESQIWSFCTKIPVLERGTLVDPRDAQFYNTIKIGEQWWMAANINYETNSGSWCYNDNPSLCATMGRLYDWDSARNACPEGWHLPSDIDWLILSNYLGGKEIAGRNPNLADNVVSSALRYRAHQPFLDSLLKEIGMNPGEISNIRNILGDYGNPKKDYHMNFGEDDSKGANKPKNK